MRATHLLIMIAVLLLSFGCVEQKGYQSTGAEHSLNIQSVDLDNDGITDYAVYDFASVPSGGLTIQRQVTVSTYTSAQYSRINTNITDLDLYTADEALNDFSKSETQAEGECSAQIGLSNVVCSDVATCSKLCTLNARCKKMAAYDEALAGSMISYVKNVNEMRILVLDARKRVVNLGATASDDDRAQFLAVVRELVDDVGELNANPLYTNPNLALCTHSDFGTKSLTAAAGMIGDYETQPSSYHYTVILSAKPAQSGTSLREIAGIGLTDKMPKTVVVKTDAISSIQEPQTSEDAANVIVSWSTAKASKDGYLFAYSFTSEQPPEVLLPSLRSPDVTVRTMDLVWLMPTNTAFTILKGIVKNYYLAMGMALGLTLAVLFFVYDLVVFLVTLVSERAAGVKPMTAFRKAFGRTDVQWKTDGVLAIIALAVAYYVSVFLAAQPATALTILESVGFLMTNAQGVVGVALAVTGTALVYMTVENLVKITILERAYGMVIRQEKDVFITKAAAVKSKLVELSELIETYRQEDFDVSQEYDIYTSISPTRVDELVKTVTPRSKLLIEEYMAKTEGAVNSIKERKRVSEEKWPEWKANIRKMLDERNEVYTSALVAIPVSLRSWALGRYAKESTGENVVFERDSLRKRRITYERMVADMIEHELLTGAMVIKQEKMVAADFAGGGTTVKSALAMKLRTYLYSLGKNLLQKEPVSFITSGPLMVIVYMRDRTAEYMLFVTRDKFKDAIEQWKLKLKGVEE